MYLALYRKWRPQRFSDVYGQPSITQILKREVQQNTVSHAYLFCGLRGTGKTTCAKILAKAVNCERPIDGEPCGKCENCLSADKGTLLDIAEIDAASNNGVDNIRSVIEEVSFLPSQGKRKVYIIDEVHMLSQGAFNALLKTLEEPPEHVIFILCTTETHKIPATILSRCQRFDFGRIEAKDIVSRLQFVAKEEKIGLSDEAAALIARLSEGAMRDALSLLDLFVGQGENIDYETACKILGVPDREKLHDICRCIDGKNSSTLLDIINGMLVTTKASAICTELIEFFRDMLITTASETPEKLINELPAEIEKCRETAKLFTRSKMLYCINILEKCLYTLPQANVNARTTLEMAALRMCNIEKTDDIEALFARVEALEKGIVPKQTAPEKKASAPKPEPVEKKAPVEKKEPVSAAEPVRAAEETAKAFADWSDFIDAVGREDAISQSFLKLGKGYIKGDKLQIVLDDSMGVFMLSKPTKAAILEKAASEVVGRKMSIELSVKKTQQSVSDLLD